ncbi:LIM and senescent cell antigen-like-containing domain protein 2 [Yarrowia sp. B02]|nr:LIM and senescent cell antigen-like-containing domain protein 2 [Yarrowia sp. B02]
MAIPTHKTFQETQKVYIPPKWHRDKLGGKEEDKSYRDFKVNAVDVAIEKEMILREYRRGHVTEKTPEIIQPDLGDLEDIPVLKPGQSMPKSCDLGSESRDFGGISRDQIHPSHDLSRDPYASMAHNDTGRYAHPHYAQFEETARDFGDSYGSRDLHYDSRDPDLDSRDFPEYSLPRQSYPISDLGIPLADDGSDDDHVSYQNHVIHSPGHVTGHMTYEDHVTRHAPVDVSPVARSYQAVDGMSRSPVSGHVISRSPVSSHMTNHVMSRSPVDHVTMSRSHTRSPLPDVQRSMSRSPVPSHVSGYDHVSGYNDDFDQVSSRDYRAHSPVPPVDRGRRSPYGYDDYDDDYDRPGHVIGHVINDRATSPLPHVTSPNHVTRAASPFAHPPTSGYTSPVSKSSHVTPINTNFNLSSDDDFSDDEMMTVGEIKSAMRREQDASPTVGDIRNERFGSGSHSGSSRSSGSHFGGSRGDYDDSRSHSFVSERSVHSRSGTPLSRSGTPLSRSGTPSYSSNRSETSEYGSRSPGGQSGFSGIPSSYGTSDYAPAFRTSSSPRPDRASPGPYSASSDYSRHDSVSGARNDSTSGPYASRNNSVSSGPYSSRTESTRSSVSRANRTWANTSRFSLAERRDSDRGSVSSSSTYSSRDSPIERRDMNSSSRDFTSRDNFGFMKSSHGSTSSTSGIASHGSKNGSMYSMKTASQGSIYSPRSDSRSVDLNSGSLNNSVGLNSSTSSISTFGYDSVGSNVSRGSFRYDMCAQRPGSRVSCYDDDFGNVTVETVREEDCDARDLSRELSHDNRLSVENRLSRDFLTPETRDFSRDHTTTFGAPQIVLPTADPEKSHDKSHDQSHDKHDTTVKTLPNHVTPCAPPKPSYMSRSVASSRPKCIVCDDHVAMNERIVQTESRDFSRDIYHLRCFRCCICDSSLEHMEHYVDPHSDMLFCHVDYHETFSPKCAQCSSCIEGDYVQALGKTFHVDHFFCAQCGKPFQEGQQHHVIEGHAYCEPCYDVKTAEKCWRCSHVFLVNDPIIEVLDRLWCEACYSCEECGVGLKEEFTLTNDGVVLCEGCQEKRVKKYAWQ